jgi:hypothetical protein
MAKVEALLAEVLDKNHRVVALLEAGRGLPYFMGTCPECHPRAAGILRETNSGGNAPTYHRPEHHTPQLGGHGGDVDQMR